MTLFVDPPSGWIYGFSKSFDPKKDNLKQMLKDSKYPEEDIEFALRHARFLGTKEELEELRSMGV